MRRWVTSWAGLGVFVLMPGLLSGNGGEASAAVSEAPVPISREADLPLDQWIRLVGVEDPAEAEVLPPTPQWGIRLPEAGAVTGAQQLLAGHAENLTVGALPVDLGRLLKQFSDANSQLQLAALGGEVQLVGGDLPPWMWSEREAVPAARRSAVLVTLPPELDGRARVGGLEAWIDGINYSDPTGIGLPLVRAAGFEYHRLSAHFTVADFQTRDHAPYMRVAGELVAGLESMRAITGPLTVISGYRHPHYNRRADIRGARFSRHQAGQAADIFSTTQTPIQLAEAAIRAMGCGIGLGLGKTTIHVDVRGYLSTWTYPGAPLSEAVFDNWILRLCGGSAPQAPQFPSRFSTEMLLALAAEDLEDETETVHTDAEAIEEAVEEAEAAAAPAPLSVEALVRRDLVDFARESYRREGLGAIVVDLRDGARREGEALRQASRYALMASPELRDWGIRPLFDLVRQRRFGTYFVYVVLMPDGSQRSGIAQMASANAPVLHDARLDHDGLSGDETEPDAEASGADTASADSQDEAVAERRRTPRSQESWMVLVASAPTMEAAQREVAYTRALLASTGYPVSLHLDGRLNGSGLYRVAVGPFTSQAEAERAQRAIQPKLTGASEAVRVQ